MAALGKPGHQRTGLFTANTKTLVSIDTGICPLMKKYEWVDYKGGRRGKAIPMDHYDEAGLAVPAGVLDHHLLVDDPPPLGVLDAGTGFHVGEELESKALWRVPFGGLTAEVESAGNCPRS